MEHERRRHLKARAASSEKWRKAAQWPEKAVMRMRDGVVQGPCSLLLEAGRPDRRRRDGDNLVKPLTDAFIHGGAIADDSDCETVAATWVADLEGVRVTLAPAGARE